MDTTENERRPDEITKELMRLCETVLQGGDRVAQILRLHALTECYIERALSVLLRKPEFVLGDSRFTYNHKLNLMQALNALPESVADALRRLSKLRNQCAHSMRPEIADAQIRDAAQPILQAFNRTQQQYEKDGLYDMFGAYVFTIFSELSHTVLVHERVYEAIFGSEATVEKLALKDIVSSEFMARVSNNLSQVR